MDGAGRWSSTAASFGPALKLADDLRQQINLIPGLRVMERELLGEQASHDLDRMQVLIDVSDLGVSGYQCQSWLRENCRLDLGPII